MMDRRLIAAYMILFALGAATPQLFSDPWIDIVGKLLGLAVLAGGVEAVATAYTGTRRWVWAWLPHIAGVIINVLVQREYQDPDIVYLLILLTNVFVAFGCVSAVLVYVSANCFLWLRQWRIWPKRSA